MKWPHSVYKNNPAVRDITVNVRKHVTTGHQRRTSCLRAPISHGLSLPHLLRGSRACLPTERQGAFQWGPMVSGASGQWPDHSLPHCHANRGATRKKRGKASPWASQSAFHFLTCAEARDLVPVILVKTNILRPNLASKSMEVNVSPQSQQEK